MISPSGTQDRDLETDGPASMQTPKERLDHRRLESIDQTRTHSGEVAKVHVRP